MQKKPKPFEVEEIEYHSGDGSGIDKKTPERVSVIGIHNEVTYHIDGIMNDRNLPASESGQSDVIPVHSKSDLLENVVINENKLPMGSDVTAAKKLLRFFMNPDVPKLITYTSEDFEIKHVSPDRKTFEISNGVRCTEKKLQRTENGGINLLQKTGSIYTKTIPTDKTLALLKNRRIVPKSPNVPADAVADLNMHVASLMMQRQQ